MSNETTLDDVLALVPCPFCGGEAEWGYHDCHDGEHHRCTQCGVEVPGGAEKWNARALPPDWHPTPEAINALPQTLRDYIHTIQTSHPSYDNAVKVRLLEEKVAMLERALGEAEATEHLRGLVAALDGAFISSWQSTHAWQRQLDDAREYLASKAGDEA